MRNVAYRPGRSILCIALIASATFVIVSLDAFRKDGSAAGTGGFPLLADSALPLVALNLPPLDGVQFVPFRVRPGDDTSCLNLYQPRRPRILAPPASFPAHRAFPLSGVAEGRRRTRGCCWKGKPAGGAIPAIADANSMTYVLHRKLGEEFELDGVRFRIVAALQDSLFQGELIVSEENFLRLFPDTAGYRFFLLNAPPGKEERPRARWRTASPITASTCNPRRRAWRLSTGWRTRIWRPSGRWARWVCCWARWAFWRW
jgi:putative ABC transport system permease protein